jgi:hypothetical protein
LFTNFSLFLNAGYLLEGRTFAYLGVPGFYPGELLLLLASLRRRNNLWHTYMDELRRRPLLPLAVALFLVWGFVESFRGYLGGYSLLDSFRGLAAHYYPLLLFVGIGVAGSLSTSYVMRHLTTLNILMGVAGIVSVWVPSDLYLPWTSNVSVVGKPAVPCFTLLLAIALIDRISLRLAISVTMAEFALLMVARSAILGGLAGGIVLLWTRRGERKRAFLFLAVSAILYAGISATIPWVVPDVGGRIGALSPSRIASRVVAIFDSDLAHEIAVYSGEDPLYLDAEAGTAQWRRKFWDAAINSLESPGDWIAGHGYGFSLGGLLSVAWGGYGNAVRTPHNFVVFLLGYTGIVGLFLYGLIVFAFGMQLRQCRPSRLKNGIIASAVGIMIMAFSGNLFESPFGAVPTYLTMGILLQLARGEGRRPLRRKG